MASRVRPADGKVNSSLGELYVQHVDLVYRYFYHQVRHRQEAEDLTATTFSKAIASIDHYQPDRSTFAAWLFGVAHRTLADYLRKAHGLQLPTTEADADNPERLVATAEQAEIVRGRLQLLPDDQRAALILRFFGELSVRDASAVMGKSDAAIKMLVHRGLCRLRTWYETEEQLEQRA